MCHHLRVMTYWSSLFMEDIIIVGTQTNGRYREVVVFAYWVVPIERFHVVLYYILHFKELPCLLLSDVSGLSQNNGLLMR